MKKLASDYFIIALGAFILALGINVFLVPVKISTGGISGIATVLYHIMHIPMSITTLIINLTLFFFGYKTLKKSSVLKNLAGIVFLSLFLQLTESIPGYSEDIMISAIFGGILVGLGVGLTVLREGSTGGSDFAALMLNKIIPHISVASFILLIDSAVILASGIAFNDVTIMFYSVLSLYISTKVTDFVLVQGDFAKSMYIISEKNEEIAKYIMTVLERGVTGIYSRGMYNNKDSNMLMCVVKSKEVQSIHNEIKKLDNNAFIIISDVREVRGEGFKEI
jgi:uncharacterized membrane-anchored protein YitT (DUF2179 family)